MVRGDDGGNSASEVASSSVCIAPDAAKQHQHQQRRILHCRHCEYSTQNKTELWRHSRLHMRPDKVLKCARCEFVTEYKHHLEYHERNHVNAKPFQCDKCSYRCVNRSMLNSHLKSHSSLCQFRCGDCCYATKYCHSLKTHLRKNGHRTLEVAAARQALPQPPQPQLLPPLPSLLPGLGFDLLLLLQLQRQAAALMMLQPQLPTQLSSFAGEGGSADALDLRVTERKQ